MYKRRWVRHSSAPIGSARIGSTRLTQTRPRDQRARKHKALIDKPIWIGAIVCWAKPRSFAPAELDVMDQAGSALLSYGWNSWDVHTMEELGPAARVALGYPKSGAAELRLEPWNVRSVDELGQATLLRLGQS